MAAWRYKISLLVFPNISRVSRLLRKSYLSAKAHLAFLWFLLIYSKSMLSTVGSKTANTCNLHPNIF